MKIQDLYINPKNVCTIGMYANDNVYGLEINGTKIKFGEYNPFDEEQIKIVAKELRQYQQQIIDEVERLK